MEEDRSNSHPSKEAAVVEKLRLKVKVLEDRNKIVVGGIADQGIDSEEVPVHLEAGLHN